jgi:hypothetical protein
MSLPLILLRSLATTKNVELSLQHHPKLPVIFPSDSIDNFNDLRTFTDTFTGPSF